MSHKVYYWCCSRSTNKCIIKKRELSFLIVYMMGCVKKSVVNFVRHIVSDFDKHYLTVTSAVCVQGLEHGKIPATK